ncbi:hypothetical protein JOQ06_003496 [Pogonophryne albipinna]|uniref:SEFIR domain-containing protein n=1 Tax=Pogonophryne albipinna TaxID=1090488 RepID=A0AAD6AH08_9TELE|nr:hypothetical protein JOQ06_003496 [Pogonophryne albipinna]
MIIRLVLVLGCLSLCVAAWSVAGPFICSQQGLECKVTVFDCLDKGWLKVYKYTPSHPEDLQVSVDIRGDESGHLQPVLEASWKLKDDGGIRDLNATELNVMMWSTNANVCVRYSLKKQLPMRSPSGEKWSFSANMLVLDPGQTYQVSVFNIPKPEINHSNYDVSKIVVVPGCEDAKMQMTRFCIERGSLWRPGITAVSGESTLAVSFTPDPLCEEYIVIVSSSSITIDTHTYKGNQTTLNATFKLDNWPKTCCQFVIEIKPIFLRCGTDCARKRRNVDICPGPSAVKPTEAPNVQVYTFVIVGVVFFCVVLTVMMCLLCRKPRKPAVIAPPVGDEIRQPQQLKQPPKVLVIYSQDHRLYRDVVLKLCAFLQAQCGTEVLVDLLDTTSIGVVGRIRWLEWQRRQLKNPSDKILVLCSRGVQAKWRAMCGQGPVKLREDVLSPTDDMLTPFLNLFLPDMHHTGMLGKYMVAYFDDISGEQDVPSVFDIGVKYKLMKHFEELYFRILDVEKYQPDQVCHIKGIGADDYSDCPSGRDLKCAVETFQAYQLDNPDWFEKECVDDEEEVITEASLLIDQLQIPPVLECVPLIRDGLPVFINEVEINKNGVGVHVLTPELNPQRQIWSVAELTPVVNPECRRLSTLDEESMDHLYPRSPRPESVYTVEPVVNNPQPPRQNWVSLEEKPFSQNPTEDEEGDYLLPINQPSSHSDQRSVALQNSLVIKPQDSSCTSMQSVHFPPSEAVLSQPVEKEEDEVLEPAGKGPNSGSDQGYISKMSSQNESALKEDPMEALRRLQEQLFDLGYPDIDS